MAHDESHERQRTPNDVQKEISQTRAELDDTLDEIGRRLSPHEIKERVIDYAEERVADVTDTVKHHTMPILVVGGVAVAAYLVHHRLQARETEARAEEVRELWNRFAAALVANGRSQYESTASELASTVSNVAQATRESVEQIASEVLPAASRTVQSVRDWIDETPYGSLWTAGAIAAGGLLLRALAKRESYKLS